MPDAGHSANEAGTAAELVAANEKFKNILNTGDTAHWVSVCMFVDFNPKCHHIDSSFPFECNCANRIKMLG